MTCWNSQFKYDFYEDSPFSSIVYNPDDPCVQELFEPGQLLDSITLGEPMNEENPKYIDHSRLLQFDALEYLFKSCFTGILKESDYCMPFFYHRFSKEKKIHYINEALDSELIYQLCNHGQVADFGNLATQSTCIDTRIRRGKHIPLNVPECPLKIATYFLNLVEDTFTNRTHMADIKVVPYKINIYNPGDFFSEHQDSAEKDLIATFIVNMHGNMDALSIDNKMWKDLYLEQNKRCPDQSNMPYYCIFWPHVPHEVKPVDALRMSITFKIFSVSTQKRQVMNDVLNQFDQKSIKDVSNATQCLKNLFKFAINTDVNPSYSAIMLQNGYGYLNELVEGDFNNLIGIDRFMYQACKEIYGETHDIVITPVMLQVHHIDRGEIYSGNQYNCSSDDDNHGMSPYSSDNDGDDINQGSIIVECYKKFTYFDEHCLDEDGRLPPNQYDNRLDLSVVKINKISDALVREIKSLPSYKPHKNFDLDIQVPANDFIVYYMKFSGYHVMRKLKKNCYIGNEYNGLLANNIYLNLLLVLKPKQCDHDQDD